MSCKKLLVSAMVLSGIMFSANVFAADLEASVEKNKHSKAYPEISKMIEYNNYSITIYLLVGMFLSVLMILPITYKTFNLPYNNYKNYNCGV